MRRKMVLVAVATVALSLAVLAACVPGSQREQRGSGTVASVSMKDRKFLPGEIVVAQGGSVTFTNDDSERHEVVGEGWQSGPMEPGDTFTHVFDRAGSFAIRCSIHPVMTGTVVVTAHLY